MPFCLILIGAPGFRSAGPLLYLNLSERDKLRAHLEVNKVAQCAISKFRFPDAQWVKPEIVARVRHLTATKYLRHGTVRGFA